MKALDLAGKLACLPEEGRGGERREAEKGGPISWQPGGFAGEMGRGAGTWSRTPSGLDGAPMTLSRAPALPIRSGDWGPPLSSTVPTFRNSSASQTLRFLPRPLRPLPISPRSALPRSLLFVSLLSTPESPLFSPSAPSRSVCLLSIASVLLSRTDWKELRSQVWWGG